MKLKKLLQMGSSVLLLGSLAACGDNDDFPEPTPTPTPPPPGAVTYQEQFGTEFAAIFNRDITEDPVDPMAGDVPDLAPADDPIPRPD
ncbi:MAG: hypothetical protein WA957_16915 [Alteraurantiacibacter sp.]